MGLTMRQKQAVTQELTKRYKRASKKEKGELLDGVIQLTGYHRSYAARMLRVKRTQTAPRPAQKRLRRRARKYDRAVLSVLREIWAICNYICGKRLAPYLPEILPVLERCGEIELEKEVRERLLQISPATIDRLLAEERRQFQLVPRAMTKPGTLLKSQIPIRTFCDWQEDRPGFVEVDLVSHDGGSTRGDFIQTLDLTDVCTGWTETQAVKNKAQVWVFEALLQVKERMPFEILGIDSDNGAEFINAHMLKFCEEHEIAFTRSRPYRKNDNCFVEQKNYSVVRKAVGYWRYEGEVELEALNRLYDRLRLYTNFFQPVMKLTEKTRLGSRVKKKYDQPRTPYRRVLESPCVTEEAKAVLEREYMTLNPVALKREMEQQQDRLRDLLRSKRELTHENETGHTLEYTFT